MIQFAQILNEMRQGIDHRFEGIDHKLDAHKESMNHEFDILQKLVWGVLIALVVVIVGSVTRTLFKIKGYRCIQSRVSNYQEMNYFMK